ncbi:hypothetical protein ACFQ5N_03195 [Lutibacter holmesii]|uniref:Lipocalin-like domain-containing protein n=1 Tax=Lutibacter holmesii TaxID=1137985 RepID=A0ABW3WL27_9FLAO
MKNYKLTFLFLLFSIMLCVAQEDKIIGEWLLTKVEVGDKIEQPYYITNFSKNGHMIVMGMGAGTWEFDKKANKIVMKSELDKDFNGDNSIISISNKELVVTKDEAKLYYLKVDQKNIESENKASGFVGEWKLINETNQTQLLKIELPNLFTFNEILEVSSTTTTGTWMYNSKEKKVIFIGRTRLFDGESTVKEISENKFIIDHNGLEIMGEKNTSNVTIERLNFTFEDLPEESTEDSPWTDFDVLLNKLSNVKHLKYKQGRLINGTNSFVYSTLLSTVKVNSNDRRVHLNNFSITQNDTLQYSESVKGYLYNEYNNFFPQEEPYPFKVINTEPVTVAAGTFNCKIVEGFEGDSKIKFWMIIDQPGVYAKIIREEIDPFGDLDYLVIELEEIK